jgi:hypothetical protein
LGYILVRVIFILVDSGRYYLLVGKIDEKFLDLETIGVLTDTRVNFGGNQFGSIFGNFVLCGFSVMTFL